MEKGIHKFQMILRIEENRKNINFSLELCPEFETK